MSTPTPLSEAVDMPEGRDVQRQTAGNYQQLRLLRACDYCRKRKVKCNGERPACSHCRRVGAHCHYSVKPKSRRTWKCLERAASSDNTSTAPADIKPNSGSSSGTVTAAATAAAVAATTTTTYNDETARLFERVEAMEKLLLHHQKQQEMQKANRARGNTPSSKLSVTGLGLCTPWMMPGTNSTIVDLPPKEIVQELVDIFFGRELGYSWIIHEQTFRKQLVQGQVPDILLYAVMAKASKYSRHPAIRVNPPSDAPLPFLHRAKLLVPHIIDKPCLAHAQALMLMASDFSGLGEDHATTAYKCKFLLFSA
ncbi:hypothetical protein EV182_001145 [Spiromyces aspiralis]|uniref:Uncharacterized protein n=1 Tax=Spiromyces aspiralis TaxID=68401 RepID=A0ACC1HFW4_9FUNG|nr:hypothetical protein EV182_001145 [Spiromyces aspiralis]